MGSLMLNGINYTEGGSDVEPNPTGEPTATLSKLGIEGTIYGIEGSGGGGTALILDAQIYSTEEREVGVWFDNKPLYSRVFDLGSDVQVSYNSFTDTSIDASDMEKVVDAKGFYSTGATAYNVMGNINNNIIRLQTDRNGVAASIRYVLLFYTKTTDTAGSGGYQAYGFSPIIYSTEERCVGVWTDNKPLYQKTFIVENVSISNTYAIDVSALDVDFGMGCKDSSFYFVSGLVRQDMNVMYESGTPNALYIITPVSRNVQKGFFTMIYTKTTDTAGSGSYNTLGIPSVHYSTDEQVVGTDEDGKTIYEKTFTIASPSWSSGSGYSTITVDISSIGTVDKLNFVKGNVHDNTDDRMFNIPYFRVADSESLLYECRVNSDGTPYFVLFVRHSSGAGYSLSNLSVTLQYTKSSS